MFISHFLICREVKIRNLIAYRNYFYYHVVDFVAKEFSN